MRTQGECNLWSMKKFTRVYLFQIARGKLCDYLLIILIKKLRDGFKIALRGSQHAKTTCKNKLFKCCKYHHTCSQNNILLDVFKVCKLPKRAETGKLSSIFPAGEGGFGQMMYRSPERSPQDSRDGIFLYGTQA